MARTSLADAVGLYAQGFLSDEDILPLVRQVYDTSLSRAEIAELTHAMIATGEKMSFDTGPQPIVDKHSTGGVGDKITLILTPLMASMGVCVPQLAGRGLGFTGGTIDKLESIPGWRAQLSPLEMRTQLERVGAFIAQAHATLVPADAKLYALRDVTGTMDSIPLIAASIMSKKIAEGTKALVLDVKWGRGAFMTSLDHATELAQVLVALGEDEGIPTRALVTNMNVPLGCAVGNAVEVAEALDVLSGRGPADVRELTLALAREMLELAGQTNCDPASHLENGRALEKFQELISAQGGDLSQGLPQATLTRDIHAANAGFLTDLDARSVAEASWHLGAGRRSVGDSIDHTAGVLLHARPGDRVDKDQPLFTLVGNDPARMDAGYARLIEGFVVGEFHDVRDFGPLIAQRITSEGIS